MPSRFIFLKGASAGLVLALLLNSLFVEAQRQDDIMFDGRDPGAIYDDTLDREYVKQEFDENYWPALKSLAVPGWGQIHNKQFKKAPVIWGATALILGNSLRYRSDILDKRSAINSRLNGFTTDEYFGEKSTLDLRFDALASRNKFRWSMAAIGFVHFFNVTDAYASAYILKSEKTHSPTKAALMSAVLPGWGQIYNKRLWKVPIVVGGLAAAGYAIWWNINEHKAPRDELFARRFGVLDGPASPTVPYVPYSAENPYYLEYFGIDDDRIFDQREFYLDQLDTAILIGVLVYAVNILDAAVDAHLRDFDIDDDLGVETSLVPAVFPNGTVGLNWSLSF